MQRRQPNPFRRSSPVLEKNSTLVTTSEQPEPLEALAAAGDITPPTLSIATTAARDRGIASSQNLTAATRNSSLLADRAPQVPKPFRQAPPPRQCLWLTFLSNELSNLSTRELKTLHPSTLYVGIQLHHRWRRVRRRVGNWAPAPPSSLASCRAACRDRRPPPSMPELGRLLRWRRVARRVGTYSIPANATVCTSPQTGTPERMWLKGFCGE
ncbi:hypothetical protein B0H11DRAFT_1905110 [Mycena galericulata]|nr:hypothetical protein B0H11DRAFT_1905110 [Mycena galericulata]